MNLNIDKRMDIEHDTIRLFRKTMSDMAMLFSGDVLVEVSRCFLFGVLDGTCATGAHFIDLSLECVVVFLLHLRDSVAAFCTSP